MFCRASEKYSAVKTDFDVESFKNLLIKCNTTVILTLLDSNINLREDAEHLIAKCLRWFPEAEIFVDLENHVSTEDNDAMSSFISTLGADTNITELTEEINLLGYHETEH
jgi:hypothetical protein